MTSFVTSRHTKIFLKRSLYSNRKEFVPNAYILESGKTFLKKELLPYSLIKVCPLTLGSGMHHCNAGDINIINICSFDDTGNQVRYHWVKLQCHRIYPV